MLEFCMDTIGYLIESTLLDEFLAVSALCGVVLVVRLIFFTNGSEKI